MSNYYNHLNEPIVIITHTTLEDQELYPVFTTLNNLFIWSCGNNLLETQEGVQIYYGVLNTEEEVEINRPPDKSAYWKILFFISNPKHMLWVLKKTVSLRRFF